MNIVHTLPSTWLNWRLAALFALTLAALTLLPALALANSPPATPASVTVTRGDGAITASGYAVSGATKYHITYSTDNGASWHAPVDNHRNWTSTSITFGADNSKTYIIGVRAGNDHGWSGWRNSPSSSAVAQSSPPATPSTVTVERSSGALTVSGYSVNDATKYHIRYSSDGGANWSTASSNQTERSMTIRNVDDAKTYVVAVRAGNDSGWSGWRNSASIGPFQTAPDAVSAVYFERGDGSIFVTWPSVSNATKYGIRYQSTDQQGWSTASDNYRWPFIIISGTDNTKTYRFSVRAGNAQGWSSWTESALSPPSDPIIISPLPPPIPQVTLTASGVTSSRATLTIGGEHTGAWWYQRMLPTGDDTCHSAGSSATATLTGLTGDTYHQYDAYNRSGCGGADLVATARFTTAYAPTPGSRDSSEDFNTLTAAGNINPGGIWSNGTTMWTVDGTALKIYAYSLSTKARDTGKDITTSSTHFNYYLASDGTTMWTKDAFTNNKLFAYSISGKNRDASKDLTLLADNQHTQGIWTNGVTIWVGDNTDTYIYAYTIADGARDSSKEFDLHADNGNVTGLWSDGTTMWVTDAADDKIYAYTLSDGSRDSAKDYASLDSENTDPAGIWSDGTTTWVLDSVDDKIYAYHSISPGANLTTLAVAPTTATLYLGAYAGSWYYKANTGPDNSCSSTAQTGNTLSLSGLSGGTTYTYTAYDESGCSSADEIASVTFTTLVSVGNLSETKAADGQVGQWRPALNDINVKRAAGFTTGSNSSGYSLQSVTAKFSNKVGSPTGFTAAIHAVSSGNPAASATCALSGSAPDTAGEYTYTPSATCDLSASTTYFLVLSASGAAGANHYYLLSYTSSSSQTNTPSNAGWTIADKGKSKSGNNNWADESTTHVPMFKVTAAAKATLSSSGVGTTGATLTIANHNGDWYYKADVAPHNTCQGPVSGSSKTLSGLSAGTTYTYTAYSDSACTSANEIAAAAAFTTTLSAPSGLSLSFQGGSMKGYWDKPTGMTGDVTYEVQSANTDRNNPYGSTNTVTYSEDRVTHDFSTSLTVKFRVRTKVGSATSAWAEHIAP